MKKISIIIPARFGSTRFPGKPLAMIAGKSMIHRVCELARNACKDIQNTSILVATDDSRIIDHVKEIGVDCVLTPNDCATGSDRVLFAAKTMKEPPEFIINLQGDAPLMPEELISTLINTWLENPSIKVVTPIVQLSWDKLDELRDSKKLTPFSGTTCIKNNSDEAIWFSKNIIPAIRDENTLRQNNKLSPIYQHFGLYGFQKETLETFVSLPKGHYESLEGLEQLRFIENNIKIHLVEIKSQTELSHIGIDSPEDIQRAEKYLSQFSARSKMA
jgi:3-deoxy-manno-octulosonate cytidylyltransferase (CMP-KDO synthetase)